MGLFSRKFDRIPTEEERYAASGAYQQTDSRTQRQAAVRNARQAQQQRKENAEAAAAQKASRVRKVGTLRKIGPNTWETSGWEIDAPGYRGGRGRVVEENVRHTGDLVGFTVQELCSMAHGKGCRCTR